MKRYLIHLFILGVVWVEPVDATVVKGVVIICDVSPRSPVAMLDVSVFDAAKVPGLVSSIKALESPHAGGEKESTKRLDAMIRIARTSAPLGRTITDRSGSFRIDIPNNVTKIVVFGYGKNEAYPYFYTYEQVPVLHRSTVDLVLEMGQYCSSGK